MENNSAFYATDKRCKCQLSVSGARGKDPWRKSGMPQSWRSIPRGGRMTLEEAYGRPEYLV